MTTAGPASKIERRGLPVNRDRGRIIQHSYGRVFCTHYRGKFVSVALRGRAAAKLWYVKIAGLPECIQGEGSTPTHAIGDAIKRNEDMIDKLIGASTALRAALPYFVEDEKGGL